jgi:hypothetical protein
MTPQDHRKLAAWSTVLPALAVAAVALAAPPEARASEICWYNGSPSSPGACPQNNCWFYEAGQLCKADGTWSHGCGCS